MARAHTVDAIKALVAALKRPKEAVPAAIALLDRGWGKPQVTVHSQQDINVLHLIAAKALGAELVPTAAAAVSTEPQPLIDETLRPSEE